LKYYLNNVGGLTSLLRGLSGTPCRRVVFSSSATVYGQPASVPITEDFPRSFANPYGHTKLVGEDILGALANADPQWQFAVLRYFNPVGAHPSGLIGESPNDIPNNLMPYITQVAVGRQSHLNIYGGDYPTVDGTGVRDFIHVCDLADGHVAAANYLLEGHRSVTANLGTGVGTSVLQMVRAFEAATGVSIPFRVVGRRPGDVAECYANCDRARALLGWSSSRTIADICADAWRWQSQNPGGFS
jgi:UDP-glucose 4-epimerase